LPEVYAATREVMRKGQTSRAKVMRKWVGAPSAGANVMRAHFLHALSYARSYARGQEATCEVMREDPQRPPSLNIRIRAAWGS